MTRGRLLLFAGILTFGAVSATSAGAVSSGPSGTVLAATASVTIQQDDDWITYEYSDELLGTSCPNFADVSAADATCPPDQVTHRGSRDVGGSCLFLGQDEGDPFTEVVIEEREIAYNPSQCLMVTERGIQPAPDEPPGDEQTETEPAEEGPGEEPQPAMTSDAGQSMALLASRTAWHKTYYEDPFRADVNSSRTNVSWTYSGGCVQSSWNHVTNYGWLGLTGWTKAGSSTTYWRGCSYARTTSNSTFLNYPFCSPSAYTITKYAPNEIKGRGDGTYVMRWYASKSGDCSYLLSFHRRHGYS